MKNFSIYFKELSFLKSYVISSMVLILTSYLIYFLLNDYQIIQLGREDGIFEYLTAILLLISSILLFVCFLRTKNLFLLGLMIVLFFGAGEEISWGQRILSFKTPETLNSINVQHEFNIHNIAIFNDQNFQKIKKNGFERLIEINMVYRIFSLIFFVFIPIIFYYSKPKFAMGIKFQMPVAPISLGIFFLLSWSTFYTLKYLLLPVGKSVSYIQTLGEVFEFTASYIYFMVALYFFNNINTDYLGKDIKETLT